MPYDPDWLNKLRAGVADESERFIAGTWALDAWMDTDQLSGRGKPGVHQTDTVKLSEEVATFPPAHVFFGTFYHGREDVSNVRFENGRVEGSFEQRGVDDISGHTVPVSGTYARDRFEVTFEFSAFGAKLRQVVQGRLVEG